MTEYVDGGRKVIQEDPTILRGSIIYPYTGKNPSFDGVMLVDTVGIRDLQVNGLRPVKRGMEVFGVETMAKCWKGETYEGDDAYFTISKAKGWKVAWDPNAIENNPEAIQQRIEGYDQMIAEKGRIRLEIKSQALRRRSFEMQQLGFEGF